MGITVLSIIIILMLFGFGERLFRGTGIPSLLAFIIAAIFLGAFFIPEFSIGKVILNVSGFILPIAVSVLFIAMGGLKWNFVRNIAGLAVVGAEVLAIRVLCLGLGENAVIVSTLVAGFLGGLSAYFISGSAKGVMAAVFGGVATGDAAFALLDYYVYQADAIYLGIRGSYNTVIIGAVFGLIVSAVMGIIIRTVNTKRHSKHLSEAESADDVDIDDSDSDKFDSFFDDEII